MLTLIKMKKTLLFVALALLFSTSSAKACSNPLNPICLFKMALKAAPGMPVLDFTSIPGIIPHIPAALLKEAQTQVLQIADDGLEKIKSGSLPSLASLDVSPPSFEGSSLQEGEELSSLESFSVSDSSDPLEVAKSVELIFLKPGYKTGEAVMSVFDKRLLSYYQKSFKIENVVEIMGFSSSMVSVVEELVSFAEDIQKQIEDADDLNKAQRANFAAHLMEYQLMTMQNQLDAAMMQMETTDLLISGDYLFDNAILSD